MSMQDGRPFCPHKPCAFSRPRKALPEEVPLILVLFDVFRLLFIWLHSASFRLDNRADVNGRAAALDASIASGQRRTFFAKLIRLHIHD
jgi:hypothetical protein